MKHLLPKSLLMGLALGMGALSTQAQTVTRYIDEVFPSITVVQDTQYTTAPGTYSNPTNPENLYMDIYMPPASDTVSMRPVVVMCHAGSFLSTATQFPSPLGSKNDYPWVELATRLAKRGYVVLSLNYRVGWNPAGNAEVREKTIVQAAYRAFQDVNACLRMFKNMALNEGNPYHVDPNKIVVMGTQAGGYLPLHMAYLSYEEMFTSERFWLGGEVGNYNAQMVDTADYGIYPGTPPPFGIGDTLKLGTFNEYGGYYDIEPTFQMGISLGGAFIDTSFLHNGPMNIPLLSMHGNQDAVTPYLTAFVAPAALNGTTIFEVSGGGHFLPAAVNRGLNAPIANVPLYQNGAWPGQKQWPGLYTFYNAGFQPYAWYNNSSAAGIDSAMAYMDTVTTYITAGMKAALGLPDIVGTPETAQQLANHLSLYPNPATDRAVVSVSDVSLRIQSVSVLDITGRPVLPAVRAHDATRLELDIQSLAPGVYFTRITTNRGLVTKQLVIQ